MKEFIQNCEYFTFNIFKNIEINYILHEINEKIKPSSEKYIFEFELLKYGFNQEYGGKDKIYFFHPLSYKSDVLMVTNKQDGRWSLAHFLSKNLDLEFYSITISNNKIPDPKNQFLFEKNGQCIRVIQAMKDPKWVFYEEGEVLWFENLDYYRNRYIKDRLNKEIIIEYCYKLGFEILNEEFWRAEKAIFLEYL